MIVFCSRVLRNFAAECCVLVSCGCRVALQLTIVLLVLLQHCAVLQWCQRKLPYALLLQQGADCVLQQSADCVLQRSTDYFCNRVLLA